MLEHLRCCIGLITLEDIKVEYYFQLVNLVVHEIHPWALKGKKWQGRTLTIATPTRSINSAHCVSL